MRGPQNATRLLPGSRIAAEANAWALKASDKNMIAAPISTPPKAYMDIIGPLINSARGFLEAGEALQAFAFVGNLSSNQVVPVMIKSGADGAKDQSARLIQSAALAADADFVFTIMEVWSLRPDKVLQLDAILDKYGSIGASPYAIDVCSLCLLYTSPSPRD